MAPKSKALGPTAPPDAADEQRRRGPRRKYDAAALLADLWRELHADPDLPAREAARRVVKRRHPARAGIDNRARHLLRVVEREAQEMLRRPGPAINLLPLALWQRCSRDGQRIRGALAARDRLMVAKLNAARRRWGALYWAAQKWLRTDVPRWDNDSENLADFVASLDECLKQKRHLFR
jgi:hypothetical protein